MKENGNIAVGHRLIFKHTQRQPADAPTESGRSHTPIGHRRTKSPFRSSSPAAIESLLQDAARGVINRGEKWGLNQAVRDVVGEVRKNVRGLQSGQMSPPVRESLGRNASSQKGHQDAPSTIAANVLRRINALEERNKQLASMLEGAVAELWIIHKELAENKPPNLKEESLTTLSVGVAKVQFVQAFLEDMSLPLPEIAVQEAPKDSSTSKNSKTHDEATEVPAGRGKACDPPASPRVVDKDSSVTRSRSKPAVTATATEKLSMSPSPTQDSVRPRLTESSFSWMLGEDKNSGSSFARASPFPPNEKRSQASLDGQEKAFLFGKDNDIDKFRRKGNQKGSAKTNPNSLPGEDIGLGDWSIHERRKD
jgi:TBC1 domain family member 5